MEWRGGVAQGELVEKLVQDWSKNKKTTTAAVYADHFKASLPVHFLNMFFNTETCLNCCWAGLTQGIQIKAKP